MPNPLDSKTDPNQPLVYQIRIKGHLDSQWADWFGNMTLVLEDNGEALLTGPVIDQAALHGLLKKVRDLGLPLLSVISLEPNPAEASTVKPKNSSISAGGEQSQLLYRRYRMRLTRAAAGCIAWGVSLRSSWV